jgi:hypothetical protein
MFHRLRVLKIAVMVLAGIAALSGVVMLLWNWLMPVLFTGAREIDYLHALGLLVLSKILFGGWRGHGGWHRHIHHSRWESMTAEEREKFHQAMHLRRKHHHE